MFVFFFFKQKTAYEMRISDWSSDVCSSDLAQARDCDPVVGGGLRAALEEMRLSADALHDPEGLKERVASSLERIDAARGRLMGRSTGLLATIGSIAPLVGLLGTVWGLLNAFIDRKRVVSGKGVSVRVDVGGGPSIQKKKHP